MFVPSAESDSVCSSHDVNRKMSSTLNVPDVPEKPMTIFECVPKKSVVPKYFDVSENNNITTDDEKFQAPPRPVQNFSSPLEAERKFSHTHKRDAQNQPRRISPKITADEPKILWGFPGNQRVLKKAPPTRAHNRALR